METTLRDTYNQGTSVSKAVMRIAARYVDRCQRMANAARDRGGEPAPVPTMLDTTLCLLMALRNGCPLDLDRMLVASGEDLDHDVGGIITHVDRRTGKVGGLFSPRMLKRVAA